MDCLIITITKNAMHVFATNAEAALWNETMLNYLEGEVSTSVADDCRKDRLANIANVVFPKSNSLRDRKSCNNFKDKGLSLCNVNK